MNGAKILVKFQIHDVKADGWMTPFYRPNVEVCKRSLCMDMIQDELLSAAAGDYKLYMCGEYDHQTGIETPLDREFVCSLSELEPEMLKMKKHYHPTAFGLGSLDDEDWRVLAQRVQDIIDPPGDSKEVHF